MSGPSTLAAAGRPTREAAPVPFLYRALRGPLRFVQGYFFRLGFLDGLAGLQVCALIAYLSYLKHARLWELEYAQPAHRTPVTEPASSGRSAA